MKKKIIFWDIKTKPYHGKFQYEEGIGSHKLSTIAKKFGFETIILKDHQFGGDPIKIKKKTEKQLCSDENIIAYSLLSDGIPLFEELIRFETAKNVPVLIGGVGATIEPERVLKIYTKGCNHRVPITLVQGDGEAAFEKLVQVKPENWYRIKDVWCINNDKLVKGSFFLLENLDLSPFADLGASAQRQKIKNDVEDSSLSLEKRLELLKSLSISQIESGRGCYYRCEFCSTSGLKINKIRKSSPKRLIDEMGHMFNEYGITFFSITDNIAFDKAEWWKEFAELMQKSDITPYIQFGGYSAPRFINKKDWLEKIIPELYSIGLRGIILGVQAGSKRVLRDIVNRPSNDPENVLTVVQKVVPLGINLKVDFIVGHPTETIDELDVTYSWINKIYQAGGEVFVRKLNVVPQSGYFHKLEKGVYSLPKETLKYKKKIDSILSMTARDDKYKEIAFSNNKIPNKYLIDRKKKVVYPSTIFDLKTLQENLIKLEESEMPNHIKDRYRMMFDLVIQLKKDRDYEF